MSPDLPLTGVRSDASRRVTDLRSCEAWLSLAPLGDPRHACGAFLDLLDQLEDRPPPGAACLAILERLRAPLLEALEGQVRRFAGRPLPLAGVEEDAFLQVTDVWLALLRAWQRLQHVLESGADGTGALARNRALLALRAVEAAGALVTTQFAARREVDEDHWRWLHQSYAHAERHYVAETEIGSASCMRSYVEVLLTALAYPYGLAAREFGWAARWARRWAPKVELWRAAENGGGLAVDLASVGGPAWTPAGVPGALRFMDCAEIGRSIARRRRLLQEGVDPSELGLGTDCARPAVDELLAELARCWSGAPQPRRHARRRRSGAVRLATSLPAMFEAIAGQSLDPHAGPSAYNRRAAEQIHIFQRALEAAPQRATDAGMLEHWQLADESPDGLQLARTGAGTRIAHRQLVALRGEGESRYRLGQVRWLKQRGDAPALVAGVQILPGLPEPARARLAAGAPAVAAFLLPFENGVAPTLMLPVGSYRNGRDIELMQDGRATRIALTALRQRGADFDWVGFRPA